MTGSLGDLFGLGPQETPLQRAARESLANSRKKAEPSLPAIRGKRIDGVLYVRAEDVADALEATVPVAAKRLIKKLRGNP